MTRDRRGSDSGIEEVAVVTVLADDQAVANLKHGCRPGPNRLAGIPVFEIHQDGRRPVRLQDNAPALAGGSADAEFLVSHHLSALIGAGKDLFKVPDRSVGAQQMWRLDQAEIRSQEGPDRLSAATALQRPDKIQDEIQRFRFRGVQVCHGIDTSRPGRWHRSGAG